MPMTKTLVVVLALLALLTACPDTKAPRDPTKPPMPSTAPATEPAAGR